eukprot:1188133-Alexandrium_andersonii.AAC.1
MSGRVQGSTDGALDVVLDSVNELERRRTPQPMVGGSSATGQPSRALACPVYSGPGVGAGAGEP